MYSTKTRERALELLEEGHNAREVSRIMGGRPGHAIIRRWASGYVPSGKRSPVCLLTVGEKLSALRRLESGEDYVELAAEIGCAPSTLLTWRRSYMEGGEAALRTRVDRFLDGRGR